MSLRRIFVVLLFYAWGAFAALIIAVHVLGLVPNLAYIPQIAGLVWAFLAWQRSLVRLTSKPTRALTTVLIGIPLIVVVVWIGSTTRTLYTVGQLALPTDDRVANYDRLWTAIDEAYPYFDIKPVNWDEIREPYRERVAAAQTEQEYFAVIADLLGTLQDSHTSLTVPYTIITRQFASLMKIDDQYVVWRVNGTDALSPGDIVTAVNGAPVEARIAALPHEYRIGSTAQNAELLSLSVVLALFDDESSLEVTVIDASGAERTLTLTAPTESEALPVITGRVLESGYGLIRIPRFWGDYETLIAEFDGALEAIGDAPGIIFDIRGNGGGSSYIAADMAGRFFTESFVNAREYLRVRLPLNLWLNQGERIVFPREPFDARPLVILTDARVVSSAEEFVLMLVDSQRAISIGRVTGGASGNPITFALADGGEAQFSIGDLRRNDGSRVEGQGIAPTIAVAWTLDDLRTGHDPDIAAAETYLRD